MSLRGCGLCGHRRFRRERRRLDLGFAALVDPRKAAAEAGQHLIADGAEMMRQLVDGDAFADQGHHVAAARRVLLEIGDVDRDQVHGDAAGDRAALADDHDLGAAGAVIGAGGAEIAVGIAGCDDREFGRPPRGPGAAIADGLAALDIADLHDARLQFDDRLHRVVGFRRRVDAVERSARPNQVELELRAQEDSRRVGQRRRHAGELAGDLAEGRELLGIVRVVEQLGGNQMAHHERDAVIAGIDAGDDGLRLANREPEPVHAGVDMNGGPAVPARAAAEHVPFGELVEIADHGPAVDFRVGLARILEVAVEHVDGRRGGNRRTDDLRFIQRGDEERLAAGVGQRARHLLGAAAIGIGLDDAGAFGRHRRLLQLAPVGDDGVEVDGEDAGRAGMRRGEVGLGREQGLWIGGDVHAAF